MEKNKSIYIFIGFIAIFIVIFILRLGQLQLWDDKYITSSSNLAIDRKITIPQRGFIYDRRGELLVANNPIYDVVFTYGKKLPDNFNEQEICNLVGIDTVKFHKILRDAKVQKSNPFPLKENIKANEIQDIQERIYRFPNLSIVNRISRDYMVPTSYHVLGSIRKISKKRFEADTTGYYGRNDRVGVSGVEASYEKELRGIKGEEFYRIDIHRNIIGKYKDGEENVKAKAGKDLMLTIDYKLQAYAEKLMKGKRGAVVAIEPATGEILAMVSSPYINPNEMKDENFNIYYPLYNKDSIYSRLNNKAAAGTYPPGSPFKLLTGLIGMQEGVIADTIKKYICHHGYQLGGGRKIGCHCGYFGIPIKVDQAIAKSCNNFFCSTYRDIVLKYKNDSIGVNKWRSYLMQFGLDQRFNNDVFEGNKGKIPSALTYLKMYGPYAAGAWKVTNTVSNGIGQGEVTETPLQMANCVAAIANRGYWIKPHIVKKINGKPITDTAYTKKHIPKIDKKHYDVVVKGMEGVFDYGTARSGSLKIKGVRMAGKTGTAQNPHGQDHSIFVLFAPVENPKIAIAVVVENGHFGATWGAPIASLLTEQYLTDTITRKPLSARMEAASFEGEYRRQANEMYAERLKNKTKTQAESTMKAIRNYFELVDQYTKQYIGKKS